MEILNVYHIRIQQQLERLLANQKACPLILWQAMSYALLGGKYLRPSLVYATVETLGGVELQADAAACAIECMHAYSLVHDDLPSMDNDAMRRGKPACHIAFGEAMAILVGDALQSLAFECITDHEPYSAPQRVAMVSILAKTVGGSGMVGGQCLDMLFADPKGDKQVRGSQDIEQMYRLKTSSLLRTAVQLGALAVGLEDKTKLCQLGDMADALGIAFQIQDDIFDEILPSQALGKPQGSDLRQNKCTYSQLLGLEAAANRVTDLLDKAYKLLNDLGIQKESSLAKLTFAIANRTY